MTGWNELLLRLLWLPEQASTIAPEIDHLHFVVIGCTLLGAAGCGGAALYFLLRYRRRRPFERTERVVSGWLFETAVISGPLALFLLFWVIGYRQFIRLQVPPRDAMDVYVMGKKWMWKFAYPGGPSAVSTLHVPAGRPVRLLITSRDVIHSFYVPDFRIKQDALPGRYTEIWFEAIRPGTHQILCAELCGIGHSEMWGEVVVHDPVEYQEWLERTRRGGPERQDAGGSEAIPVAADIVAQGERLAAETGCLKCHTVDGSPHIGPTFAGLYQKQERLQGGETAFADEGYLTESIMDPMARIVAGYSPVMPTYQGRLAAPELAAIVEYIKSLASPPAAPLRPSRPVYEPAPARR